MSPKARPELVLAVLIVEDYSSANKLSWGEPRTHLLPILTTQNVHIPPPIVEIVVQQQLMKAKWVCIEHSTACGAIKGLLKPLGERILFFWM